MKATVGRSQISFIQRICLSLFRPVDNSFLIFFRIVFGAVMFWEAYRYLTSNWISRYYIEPTVYFTYYGFSWVKPWPDQGMYVHFVVLATLALGIFAGFLYRIAATFFFLAFTYVFLLDQTRYLNHFYLISLISFILIFLPAERALSVDVLLRPKIRSDTAPAWTLWLLRAQVGIAYFFGGIAKLNSDWFHGEPMRTWLRPLTKLPLFGPLFAKEWVVYHFVIGGLLLDLLVVPLMLWRRTRPYAFIAAIIFNLLNALLFQIGIFPWFMLGATLIFFPPDSMRRVVRWLIHAFASSDSPSVSASAETRSAPGSTVSSASPSTVAKCDRLSAWQKAVAVLLTTYLALQFVFPLRHYAYPGNVSWTEEGHNFSWHMKLRTKTAEALFTVTHPTSGRTWTIDPKEHLGAHQVMKMATHPDMILQFSHYLAKQKRREGYENVEVRARVMASLNGRRPQLLIDPTADLAKERLSLLPARWILPLTEPLPARGSSQIAEDPDN
ncbi:MAG TPA: HTTM domain-containing protein [Pyrinomonadaceae bacterium]|nr:HTTM domain-containing protein [Pyrinomonadaceae bacterium]